jgi:hypothetical protein
VDLCREEWAFPPLDVLTAGGLAIGVTVLCLPTDCATGGVVTFAAGRWTCEGAATSLRVGDSWVDLTMGVATGLRAIVDFETS